MCILHDMVNKILKSEIQRTEAECAVCVPADGDTLYLRVKCIPVHLYEEPDIFKRVRLNTCLGRCGCARNSPQQYRRIHYYTARLVFQWLY